MTEVEKAALKDAGEAANSAATNAGVLQEREEHFTAWGCEAEFEFEAEFVGVDILSGRL